MSGPLSTRKFLWAWSKYQIRIKLNALNHILSGAKKKDANKKPIKVKRQGSVTAILLSIAAIGFYAFITFFLSVQVLNQIQQIIGKVPIREVSVERPLTIGHVALRQFQQVDKHVLKAAQDFPDTAISTLRQDQLDIEEEIQFQLNNSEIISDSPREALRRCLSLEHLPTKHSPEQVDQIIDLYIKKGLGVFTNHHPFEDVFLGLNFSGSQTIEFLHWVGFYFILTICGITLMEGIGNKNPMMHSPEEDLEHLTLYPVKSWVLFVLPLVQRTVFNPINWVFSLVPCIMIFLVLDHDLPEALGYGTLVAICFNLCLASAQVFYQFLGRYSSNALIRKICSLMQILGMLCFFLIIMGGQSAYILRLLQPCADANPGGYFPLTQLLGALHTGHWSIALLAALAVLTIPLLALYFIAQVSRGGIPLPLHESGSKAGSGTISSIFSRLNSGYSRSALRLLRDRNYLISVLVSPLILFGFYLLLISEGSDGISGPVIVAMVFGACAFIILNSVLNMAAHEGPHLWLLYCGARPVGKLLMPIIHFWIKFVLLFACTALAILWFLGIKDMELSRILALLAGIPSLCYIAASISFAAYEPVQGNTVAKPDTTLIYFYMYIAAMYGQIALAGMPGAQYTVPILFTALALAWWQDCTRKLPYYFDPEYTADNELTLKNAILWCLCFFSFQSLAFLVFMLMAGGLGSGNSIPMLHVMASYAIAGVLTVACAGIWYRKRILHRLPTDNDRDMLPITSQIAIILGVGSVLIALAKLYTVYINEYFPNPFAHTFTAEDQLWLAVLVVFCAPLLEEFLFRRLLLVALLRELKPRLALLAAALIFAAVHPLLSFPAVFCLGLACSWIYWRSGRLWTAIALHAFYNAGIIFISFN